MYASSSFVGVMHGYRFATEPSTRNALSNQPFGYFAALGAMHGWSDGDGYFENYLGHPIQGAVSDYLWIHNDPRYRNVEFGKKHKINGTPTLIFTDGSRVPGAIGAADIEKMLAAK